MTNALDLLGPLAALLLATSLAAERLVVIMKTIFHTLAEENSQDPTGRSVREKGRRITVQMLAFLASYMTLALVFSTVDPLARIKIGPTTYYLGLLAFLGSGGSAFWSGVVGYVRAAKDVKTVESTVLKASRLSTGGGLATAAKE